MDDTVQALRNFLSIAEGYSVTQLRAIATSAVREAINGRAFCDRLQVQWTLPAIGISAVGYTAGIGVSGTQV